MWSYVLHTNEKGWRPRTRDQSPIYIYIVQPVPYMVTLTILARLLQYIHVHDHDASHIDTPSCRIMKCMHVLNTIIMQYIWHRSEVQAIGS